jgi:phosphatidylinositol glycan class B
MLLGLGFAVRLVFALSDDGIYWPDEVYQSLEPGHWLAFGYGLLPWEYVDGARSWILPALIAGIFKGFSALGLGTPEIYLPGLEVLLCALGTATAYASYLLVRSLGGSWGAGLFAAALFSFGRLGIYFAPRALSETVSALPLALGFALALSHNPSVRRVVLGALLLSVATWLRLQNGVFCVALGVIWISRREWRPAMAGGATMLLSALALGLLDLATWGSWFHSARLYIQFNLLEGRASAWGTSPPGYYLRRLFSSMPTLALPLLLFPWGAARKAPGLLAAVIASLALHSWVPHKELRFILPTLPLLCALAALGGEIWLLRAVTPKWRPWVVALAMSLTVASTLQLPSLTFGALGQYGRDRRNDSALDDGGATNRLLLVAHRRPDLCGLKVESRHLAWTGGLSRLHRPVPIYPHQGADRSTGHFNYVISRQGAPLRDGETVVSQEGAELLLKIREDCLPDPGYSWRLP